MKNLFTTSAKDHLLFDDPYLEGLGMGKEVLQAWHEMNLYIQVSGVVPSGRTQIYARVLRLPPTGLLPWLIVSDLAHFWPQHVAPPTVEDLSQKIYDAGANSTGGQGPWSAFRTIDPGWTGRQAHTPSPSTIKQHLESIRATLDRQLPADVRRDFSGGLLGWEDVEHILCKVTRLGGLVRFRRERRSPGASPQGFPGDEEPVARDYRGSTARDVWGARGVPDQP